MKNMKTKILIVIILVIVCYTNIEAQVSPTDFNYMAEITGTAPQLAYANPARENIRNITSIASSGTSISLNPGTHIITLLPGKYLVSASASASYQLNGSGASAIYMWLSLKNISGSEVLRSAEELDVINGGTQGSFAKSNICILNGIVDVSSPNSQSFTLSHYILGDTGIQYLKGCEIPPGSSTISPTCSSITIQKIR